MLRFVLSLCLLITVLYALHSHGFRCIDIYPPMHQAVDKELLITPLLEVRLENCGCGACILKMLPYCLFSRQRLDDLKWKCNEQSSDDGFFFAVLIWCKVLNVKMKLWFHWFVFKVLVINGLPFLSITVFLYINSHSMNSCYQI